MLEIRQDIAARLFTAFRLTFILLFLEYLIFFVLYVSIDYGYVLLTGDFESSARYDASFAMFILVISMVTIIRFMFYNYLFVFVLFAAFLEDEGKLAKMIFLNTVAYLVSLSLLYMIEYEVLSREQLLELYTPQFPLALNIGLFSLSAMLISPAIIVYGSRCISKKILYPAVIVLALSPFVAGYATA